MNGKPIYREEPCKTALGFENGGHPHSPVKERPGVLS